MKCSSRYDHLCVNKTLKLFSFLSRIFFSSVKLVNWIAIFYSDVIFILFFIKHGLSINSNIQISFKYIHLYNTTMKNCKQNILEIDETVSFKIL